MCMKLVRAMLVTGARTCCRACITFTRNASTALRLQNINTKCDESVICRLPSVEFVKTRSKVVGAKFCS